MSYHYSASRRGFFHDDVHGARHMTVEGERVQNPDTLIPDDAVEISDEMHMGMMLAQTTGKIIVPGTDGRPMLADPPPPTRERQVIIFRHHRAAELIATDGLMIAEDSPLTPEQKVALKVYRQTLRDHTTAAEIFPFPERPDFLKPKS